MATITASQSLDTMQQATRRPRVRFGLTGIKGFVIYAILIGGSLFFIFPLINMLSTSFKTITEIQQPQLNLIPAELQWVNYTTQLQDPNFYVAYTNSVFIVTVVLLGTVTSIALVAFAFSRLTWPGKSVVFALMLGTLLLPYQATLVPQYALFYGLGWLRTFNPITIPGFFAGGASLVFLLRQFMMGLPKELDEAAMLDGANPLQIWWYVILPLCRPALATISVFLFVGQWNSLLQPVIYLQRDDLYTMPLYVAKKLNLQEVPLPWQDVAAASVLFVIPVLVVFLLTQRYFVEGVTLTGSKG